MSEKGFTKKQMAYIEDFCKFHVTKITAEMAFELVTQGIKPEQIAEWSKAEAEGRLVVLKKASARAYIDPDLVAEKEEV